MNPTPPRFGVLINPTAGHGRGRRLGREALAELERRALHVVDLSHPTPEGAFTGAVQRQGEYDVLIVVGGDGMVHMGINIVAGTTIPLGLIAAGSGNDFARHLNLPIHRVEASIETILGALREGAQAVDAVKITPLGGGRWEPSAYPRPYRWAGCVVSAGFDSVVNARANTYVWPRGMGRYLRGVLQELPTFDPYPYRVVVDGEARTFRGTLVAVANAPSFGGGMKIAPAARASSGTLEVVIAGEIGRWELLRVFPKVYRGGHVGHPAVTVTAGRQVTIEADGTGTIPPIFADGEYIGAGPVSISIEGGALRMLCPRLEV